VQKRGLFMIKHCMRDQNVAEKDTLVTVEVLPMYF